MFKNGFSFYVFNRQARFVLPGSPGSPPKILTFDEVRDAIKNVEDMQLAHEIAINPDFRLQPYDPPADSLEKRIKEIMHDCFWQLLKEQLSADPPCYDHAITLLSDIKEVRFPPTPQISIFFDCFLNNNK